MTPPRPKKTSWECTLSEGTNTWAMMTDLWAWEDCHKSLWPSCLDRKRTYRIARELWLWQGGWLGWVSAAYVCVIDYKNCYSINMKSKDGELFIWVAGYGFPLILSWRFQDIKPRMFKSLLQTYSLLRIVLKELIDEVFCLRRNRHSIAEFVCSLHRILKDFGDSVVVERKSSCKPK